MRAAIVRRLGEVPEAGTFEEPQPGEGEVVLTVRASPLTTLTRAIVAGRHYLRYPALPAVAGVEGIGIHPDGRRVYSDAARPPFGFMAERTVVSAARIWPVPDGIDDATAAALPNAAVSSWVALEDRARLRRGETVVVLGATGVSGSLAVPIARHLGAGRVVAVGRNEEALRELRGRGADAVVRIDPDPAAFRAALAKEAAERPFDVVVDYLWGAPAEAVLSTLIGHAATETVRPVRYVSVGSMAGPELRLPSEVLRSSGLEILGNGIGSRTVAQGRAAVEKAWALARSGGLSIATEVRPLSDVAEAWATPRTDGRRTVLVP